MRAKYDRLLRYAEKPPLALVAIAICASVSRPKYTREILIERILFKRFQAPRTKR